MFSLKIKRKNKMIVLILFSLFLVLLGIFLIISDLKTKYEMKKEDEVLITSFFENNDQKVNTNDKETEEVLIDENNIIEETEKLKPTKKEKNYIFVLEIPKINLKRGVFEKNSSNNNVDRNIEILKESDLPNKLKGNVILAGHSGNSSVSFFKRLPFLKTGDVARIYYEGNVINYQLVNYYEIEKTGYANIIRNQEIETLTLITCKHNTNKQYVFIFELIK